MEASNTLLFEGDYTPQSSFDKVIIKRGTPKSDKSPLKSDPPN